MIVMIGHHCSSVTLLDGLLSEGSKQRWNSRKIKHMIMNTEKPKMQECKSNRKTKNSNRAQKNNYFWYGGIHQLILMLILKKYLNNMVILKNAGKLWHIHTPKSAPWNSCLRLQMETTCAYRERNLSATCPFIPFLLSLRNTHGEAVRASSFIILKPLFY